MIDVERRDAVAELAERQHEAGRVGAARDQAEHLAAGLDQLVTADVSLDPLEDVHGRKSASPRRSREPPFEPAHHGLELGGGERERRRVRAERHSGRRLIPRSSQEGVGDGERVTDDEERLLRPCEQRAKARAYRATIATSALAAAFGRSRGGAPAAQERYSSSSLPSKLP